MRKSRVARWMAAGMAAVLALSMTACSGGSSAGTESKGAESAAASAGAGSDADTDLTLGLTPLAERTTLSIGFFAGSAHSMPWYVADQMGFFDALNIDVEYQSFTAGPAMMEASADWDVCDVGAPGVLNGMKNYDINMIGVCDNEYNTALFVRPDTDLAKDPSNPENWRGKEVLLNKGTTLQYMFMQYMNSIGITDLEAYDITITDTAVGTSLTAFQTGQGDALCVWNAFAYAAEDDGNIRVTDIGEMKLNNVCGLCATNDAITNKTELVKLAYQVYYKTWEWAQENEDNMQQAKDLFLESCEDEGVMVTEDTVSRLFEDYQCPSLEAAVAEMTTEQEDRNGSGTKVTEATNMLFETLDFFITLGNYTEDDRQSILDKGLVNPVIAEAIAG